MTTNVGRIIGGSAEAGMRGRLMAGTMSGHTDMVMMGGGDSLIEGQLSSD